MDTLLSMKVFCQVVESGSFTAAGLALEMSVAMVSKHVQNLESHLGTRLLHRTSRKLSLNDPGGVYYERCREILQQIEEAEGALGREFSQPRGTLRLSAPSWFGNRFFASHLMEYRRRYPEVQLDVHLSDALVDLAEEGLDLALRIARQPDPRWQAREMRPIHFAMLASRDYLARYGKPERRADLERHELLLYTYGGFENFTSGWRLDNTSLIGELAAQGAGIAVLPRMLVDQESYRQELEEIVLPDVQLPTPMLYAVTHGRRQHSARVRCFLDFMLGNGCAESCSV